MDYLANGHGMHMALDTQHRSRELPDPELGAHMAYDLRASFIRCRSRRWYLGKGLTEEHTMKISLFDEKDWPKDPRVDVFRDAVWELSLNGEVVGWLTTSVNPMRALPAFWLKQEQMWAQVHWHNGASEFPEEDYGPGWYAVEELLGGSYVTSDPLTGLDVRFNATVVTGPERDQLWAQLDHGALG